MKKIIVCVVMTIAMVFALCGCGGPPLLKAYESLSTAAETAASDGTNVVPPFIVNYDEESDTMMLKIDNTIEPKTVFDPINEEIDGEDIGTIYFSLQGIAGDGFESKIDKKIGQLSCNSMKMLGLDYYILNAESHNWLNMAGKTESLYIDSPISVFAYYNDKDKKKLGKFKDVKFAYNDTLDFDHLDLLPGVKTISLVPPVEITKEASSEDPLDNVLEDNEYLSSENSATEANATTETSAEGEAPAADPIIFNYFNASSTDLLSFKDMKKLTTLLIYPETGYTLGADGERFIKLLQFIRPDLQINAPGEAFDGESLISIGDIKTPNIPDEYGQTMLAELLENEVEDVYKKCSKFESKDADPVLKGKCLIYKADPDQEDWSTKRVFSSTGEVLITEPAKDGIKVPTKFGDYKTFVYVYPTYVKTGTYTSGTKAYSQTMNVQVFDLKDKVAYKSVSIKTVDPPQSFSYYAGSVPDKHSGEVDIEEVYNYLKSLKKQ